MASDDAPIPTFPRLRGKETSTGLTVSLPLAMAPSFHALRRTLVGGEAGVLPWVGDTSRVRARACKFAANRQERAGARLSAEDPGILRQGGGGDGTRACSYRGWGGKPLLRALMHHWRSLE